MNRSGLHDSDESDSDFCPEKETANEVSEEASSELSSCSEGEEKSEEKLLRKKPTKTSCSSKRQPAKKLKRRRTNGDHKTTSDTDDECALAETERKRSTRQTDADAKRLSSGRQKDNLESDDEDKSRSDALWADFLSDVKPKGSNETTTDKQQTSSTNATSNNGKPANKEKAENGHTNPKNAPKGEATKLSSAKEKPSETKSLIPEKIIKVTEIVDFAGEEVFIQKEVNADSVKENKETKTLKQQIVGASTARAAGLPIGLKRPMAAGGSGISGSGGLGSILNQIGKKKKISVLEKSQLDWKSFKQNEGIEEELQTFNKGKDGYLERQDFLQRTDLRQFEIEKNLRQSRRNN
ncbi:craniofacial development protein 1 isoform X2 [Eurosta solidaginis]|uniref:craniofacial development protein 1 isoform X2 n=1 Tax=Eurosta solidaginis TaxID=178769 RepID=UPI0035305A2F